MRYAAVLLICVAGSVFAEGPACTPTTNELPLAESTTLAGFGGSFHYDDIVVDILNAADVTATHACDIGNQTVQCLLVPKYPGSDACDNFHLDICFDDDHPAGPNDFCVVTDEFSQLGLLLAMSEHATAVAAFPKWVNTVKLLSSFTQIENLPAWNVRVRIDGMGKASIERWNDDDASDATARIILALYVAAASPAYAADRATYEELANTLANRFAHFDLRDTRNAYGAGRFWLASGKNAAANAVTNANPFTFAGYFGDAALAMMAAYRFTGETRYADLASDIIANYLRASGFTTSFAVPPVKFSWSLAALPPAAVAREDFSGHWDDADAPRAVSICKAAWFAQLGSVPVDASVLSSLSSYCAGWMQSNGVLNGDAPYQRQYNLDGTRFGDRSLHYWNTGLGAALNFFLCPNDLKRRLDAAALQYNVSAKVFRRDNGSNESCLGVYSHAFFMTSYGSAIGRDEAAFEATVATPQNLTITPSGQSWALSWNGTPGATYEVARGCNAETFAVVHASEPTTTWTDNTTLVPGASYLYKVRAVAGNVRSRFTSPVPVPDTPLEPAAPRVTKILAEDIRQIQRGVNRIRAAASLPAISYPPITAGVDLIESSDFSSLQGDINTARQAVGRTQFPFTTIGPNQLISAKTIEELRDAVRACPDGNLTQASE